MAAGWLVMGWLVGCGRVKGKKKQEKARISQTKPKQARQGMMWCGEERKGKEMIATPAADGSHTSQRWCHPRGHPAVLASCRHWQKDGDCSAKMPRSFDQCCLKSLPMARPRQSLRSWKCYSSAQSLQSDWR